MALSGEPQIGSQHKHGMATMATGFPGIPSLPAQNAAAKPELAGPPPSWVESLDEDAQRVERCLNGDETAWEDLVKVHTRRVYAICYRFTGREHEAQDLTQEVFLRIFKTLRSFRSGEGSFTVWLTRLTRNLLIDNYRRNRLERASDSLEGQESMLEANPTGLGRADGLLAQREASQLLQSALLKLSPELREAVILRDLEEMEYREIADALSIPEGTVKSRLNRGRAELAKVLKRQKVVV